MQEPSSQDYFFSSYLNNSPQQSSTTHPFQSQCQFLDVCNYIANTLKPWGILFPTIAYTPDGQRIVECALQLVRRHQKDVAYKQKVKEDLAKKQFQVDMASSEIKRIKNQVQDYKRQLGSSQNKLKADQLKCKKDIDKITAQRNLILQANKKLQQKNNQLMHQLKKKELQCQRLKDTIKKPAEKGALKNGIEMTTPIQNFKHFTEKTGDVSINFLKEKLERQRKFFQNQSEALKQQLKYFYQTISQFLNWLRQSATYTNKSMALHAEHNIEFSGGILSRELEEIIEEVKKRMSCNQNLNDSKEYNQVQPTSRTTTSKKPREPLGSGIKFAPKIPIVAQQQPPIKEFSELSIIEHASLKDFQVQGPPALLSTNSHWDILNQQ